MDYTAVVVQLNVDCQSASHDLIPLLPLRCRDRRFGKAHRHESAESKTAIVADEDTPLLLA